MKLILNTHSPDQQIPAKLLMPYLKEKYPDKEFFLYMQIYSYLNFSRVEAVEEYLSMPLDGNIRDLRSPCSNIIAISTKDLGPKITEEDITSSIKSGSHLREGFIPVDVKTYRYDKDLIEMIENLPEMERNFFVIKNIKSGVKYQIDEYSHQIEYKPDESYWLTAE